MKPRVSFLIVNYMKLFLLGCGFRRDYADFQKNLHKSLRKCLSAGGQYSYAYLYYDFVVSAVFLTRGDADPRGKIRRNHREIKHGAVICTNARLRSFIRIAAFLILYSFLFIYNIPNVMYLDAIRISYRHRLIFLNQGIAFSP